MDFAWQKRRPHRSFVVDGVEYRHFVHYYNRTWRNERAVEIPLALAFLEARSGPVLEVGNVLIRYGRSGHVVVDKYEHGPGVLNIDVVEYRPAERFSSIVMISTLEHIGWDEDEKDPTKILRAIRHLQSLLSPEGRMLVTCPLSYNPNLDGIIADDRAGAARQSFLARRHGSWRETDLRTAFGGHYHSDSRGASGLWVAQFAAVPGPG
jgi:hypothetical protein